MDLNIRKMANHPPSTEGGIERRKVNVLEMKCLLGLVGVSEWIELGMKRREGDLE